MSDVRCQNAILVHDRLKIIDFEGCSIDGAGVGSCYGWFSYRRSTPSTSIQTDIFAFGCMIYEVMTGQPPHEDLMANEHRAQPVEQRYAEGQSPDVESLPLGDLIHKCWHGTIGSTQEVGKTLQVADRWHLG
ncbi:hypothetical protein AYO21_05567 [Fonsecaea monophora]|uniref:Serine-threonine/tyrosine-protein kinase catalytic domain-containing protein n=1 Tax=Fonsecaea monophora TaxID=254056 RepID=A0A177F7T7_9EURO|nr:hypothetical protein AYO21_05567 [Fonsecaea monophora]KAH0845643.1 hypothetical protein FOPE_12633 [Fonsecaea pedrosoi]OAG40284.1 hypothetical protein AYO21_05567 [Fonsecaea monophora]